jgi:mannose-6-phosphate isomerase class I
MHPKDIIAERWMVSDDRKFPSLVIHENGVIPFPDLLLEHGIPLLGSDHLKKFGPCLKVIMKLLDTHDKPSLGSLSVQAHPKTGHPKYPSKLEMWKGRGKIYLGWNQDMTPALIAEASSQETLEHYLNSYSLNNECVVVPGGIVHAIRYSSFLSEWSESPGIEDTRSIQDSTIALYDRTDGKLARPGKENLLAALDLFEHANTFGAFIPSIQSPKNIEKNASFERWKFFHTPKVHVEEWRILKEFSWNLHDRGFPAYVESGSGEVWTDTDTINPIQSGEELFFPASLEKVTFKALTSPLVIQVWKAPL